MPALWPADLPPLPLLAGFQMQLGSSLQFSDTDKGPPKRRSTSDYTPDQVVYTLEMTVEQWESFVTFFKVTLANGALTFNTTEPITRVTATYGFADGPTVAPWDSEHTLRVGLPLIRYA